MPNGGISALTKMLTGQQCLIVTKPGKAEKFLDQVFRRKGKIEFANLKFLFVTGAKNIMPQKGQKSNWTSLK